MTGTSAPPHPRLPALRQAAALLLGYPGDGWHDRLTSVADALAALDGPGTAELRDFCAQAAATDPLRLAADYVDTFDRSRRRTLHLTYYTDGDTRRRGARLAALKSRYRAHGWEPPAGELPDFLPALLEFAARSPGAGEETLRAHRPGLELLRLALEDHGGPYRLLLRAVCASLPGPSPADRAAARRLARGGPPVETVGLEVLPQVPAPATHTEGARR